MALVSLAVLSVATGGIIYAGKKISNALHKTKSQQDSAASSAQSSNPSLVSNIYAKTNKTLQKITLGESRKQQLQEFSSEAQAAAAHAENQELNRKMVIFSGSFGLAITGNLLYAPLASLSAISVLYIVRDALAVSVKVLTGKSKANVDFLASILVVSLLLRGYFISCHLYLLIYIFNRSLLNKVKAASKKSIVDVFRDQPSTAWVLIDGAETELPIKELRKGDIIVVTAGGTIPVDGIIVAGFASIDQRLLTGESQPAEKTVGDHVLAVTIILSGWVHIEIDKMGEQTASARIGDILNQTVNFKTDQQLWAERVTDQAVMPTLAVSAVALPLLGPTGAMIVLNSHFRYRLNITTSVSAMNFLNLAAQKGILIKSGIVFEQLNKIDTVVFDKTGTLTEDKPHVWRIHSCGNWQETKVIELAAAAEVKQNHPIAQSILDEAQQRGLQLPNIDDDISYKVGYGLTVSIENQKIRIGSLRFMETEGFDIPPSIWDIQQNCNLLGHSLVAVTVADEVIGAIELRPTIRAEAKTIIQGLRERNIQSMYIISGDQAGPTAALANELGIENYFAEVLPEQKADLIQRLQQEGRSVCYVGDGINDAIALQQASVSVSLRGASTVATDIAQVILMDQSLTHLCELFDLADEFEKNVKLTSNLVIAPCLVNLGCALIEDFDLPASMFLNGVSAAAGFSGAAWPLVQHRQKRLHHEAKPTDHS